MRTRFTDSWQFFGSLEDAYADCKRRLAALPFTNRRDADVRIEPFMRMNTGEVTAWSVRIDVEVIE